jgi:predicted Zn-dependent protease
MSNKVTVLILIAVLVISGFLGCSRSTDDKLAAARKMLFEKGKVTEAKKLFDELAKEKPDLPIAEYSAALIDEYKGFEQEALPEYLEAAKAGGGFWPAMDGYTRIAIKFEYLDNARKMAYIMSNRQPQNPLPHQYLSQIYMRWEVADSATAHLTQAINLGYGDANKVLLGAEMEFRSYDSAATAQALERFHLVRKYTVDQLIWAAELLEDVSRNDSAVAYIRKAAEMEPGNVAVRLQLAQHLYDGMHLTEAEEVIDKVLKETEQCGPALILKSEILTAQNKEVLGEHAYLQYVALRENSPYALERHGLYAASKKQKDVAMADYESAYIMAANNQYPDDYIYRLYIKMQNAYLDNNAPDLAAANLADGNQLAPDSIEVDFIKKEVAYRIGQSKNRDSLIKAMDAERTKNMSYRKWLELAAKYYARTRQFDNARAVYWRLLDLPKNRLDYFLSLIDLADPAKDVAAIDSLLKRVPLRFHDNRLLNEAAYEFYAAAGKNDQALILAEKLYHNAPDYLPYLSELAGLKATMGRVADARGMYASYIASYPKDPAGYYERGRFELDHGSIDSVSATLGKALAIDFAYGPALELKGEYFAKAGQSDSAADYFRRVIKLEMPSSKANYYLADYLYQKGDSLDRAAGLGMAALPNMRNDPRGILLLGKIYYKQQKFQLALTQFQSGGVAFASVAELPFWTGKTLFAMNKKAEGKKELQKALGLNLPEALRAEAQALLNSR